MTEHPDATDPPAGRPASRRSRDRPDERRERGGGQPTWDNDSPAEAGLGGTAATNGTSASPGTAPERLARLTRMISALDAVAARLQESPAAAAIPRVVGEALRGVGIESQVALFDAPAERRAGLASESALADAGNEANGEKAGPLRISYISIPSAIRPAIELLLGRPVAGLPLPPDRVAVIGEVLADRRARYVGDTHDAIRQIAPWVPSLAVRQLMRLAHARTSIVAPLLSRGHALGVMSVWADDLRPEDLPVIGAFARQASIALDNARLREEMARQTARLEAVFAADPGGIGVLEGPDAIVRMANPRLRALSARPELAPIGRSVHALFPPEAISLFTDLRAVLERARTSREATTVSDLAVREMTSGALRTLTLHIVPIAMPPAGAGGMAGAEANSLLLIAWDTTARTRAELGLEAQVRRAQTLAGVALALGQTPDLEALLGYIAQAARDLTGADAAGFLLRDAPDAHFRAAATAGLDPESLPAVRRLFVANLRTLRPLLEHGEPLRLADAPAVAPRVEARLLARGGVRSLAGVPLVGTGGWMLGALVVGQREAGAFTREHADLLAALAAQAAAAVERAWALDEAQRRADELEATFASMIEGVAIYDPGGTLIRMNAAGERITRHAPKSGESADARRSRFGLRGADGSALARDEMPSARAVQGETFTSVDYLVDGEDGAETVISVSGAPLRAADGTVRGGVVIFRNVTALRRLERRTHQALDALLGMASSLVTSPRLGDAATETGSGGIERATEGDKPNPPMSAMPADETAADEAAEGEAPEGEATASESPRAATETRARDETWGDPRGTLRQICQLTTRVLDCDRVSITLLDPDTGYLLPVAIAGLTPEEDTEWTARQRAVLERGGTPFGQGLDEEVVARLRDGVPVVVDMSRPPYRDLPNPYGAQSVLVVPMRVDATMLGLVALDSRPRHPDVPAHSYTAEEVALARGIAQLAALAVERQRLERVAAEVEALRTANALKEEFLSIASHELKTPLTVLQARTQAARRRLLRMGYADAAAQFSAIQTALTRMLSLVEELLNAARIEAGRLDLQVEPCDLGALVAAVVDEQREISVRAIVLEGADATGLQVEGDPERLTQVLTNLLANGVKYSPAESTVRIRVARVAAPSGADEVVVTVADAGVGIPRDEVARVFERFYRASTSSARQYGGLGLGLHIAATIIERHGGRIWAESPGPGLGSTFAIALPALPEARSPAERSTDEPIGG